MAKRKLRLIQVGVGGWGWSWAAIVRQSEDWECVAYVDVSEDYLKKVATEYGMPSSRCYKDLSHAIKNADADAILSVVPTHYHAQIAIEGLEAGLHVLTEKPLADSMENAKAMVQRAEKHGLKLMVSQNYRFRRAPRTAAKIMRERFAGDPGYVVVNFHKRPEFAGIYYLKLPEPIITEMSIHHFDQMRHILGIDPIRMHVRSWRPKWSWFDGNPIVNALIEMEKNVWINYFGSWITQGWETTWDGDWRIECTEGEVHWHNNTVKVILQEPTRTFKTVFTRNMFERTGILEVELVPMPLEDRWFSLHEFAESIMQDRDPETNAKDNLKSLAMMFAAVDSSKTGKTVDMKSYT